MARRASLNGPRIGRPLALIAGGVLLAHAVALEWLARQQLDAPVLQPLANPMFTRLLAPAAPPPVQQAQPARPPRPQRPPVSAIAASAPEGTQTVATAEPPPSEPTPAPPPQDVAEPPTAQAVDAGTSTVVVGPTAAPTEPAAATDTLAALDTWPRDTRLNYQLDGMYRSGRLYGNAHVQWQREANRYQTRVEFSISLAGSRVLTSQGEVTADGLVPRAYEEMRNGKRRGVRLGDAELLFADGSRAPRPDGVQDTASQFVELSHRFATGREPLEVGKSVSVWLARPGQLDLWTYDVIAQETLQAPRLGRIDAWRLKPRPIANPRGNITAEIWFAPSLQYLPVRIRISMGDEAHIDLVVDTIEQR